LLSIISYQSLINIVANGATLNYNIKYIRLIEYHFNYQNM